jgi:hypothetical protein
MEGKAAKEAEEARLQKEQMKKELAGESQQ